MAEIIPCPIYPICGVRNVPKPISNY